MPELNNEFQIPRAEATSFEDGDQLDFRPQTSENIRSLNAIRESVRIANETYEPQPQVLITPEIISGLTIAGAAAETLDITKHRKYIDDSQINIFDQPEAA